MRQLFAQSRHSSTWILAVIIAALSVLVALTSRRTGLDLWPDVVTGLSQAGIFSGTLAAGFCAFEASRWAVPASARLTGASRNPLGVRLLHATAVILPVLSGYAAALVILTISGGISGRYGVPYGPWLLALGAALLLASTVGYAIGAAGGRRWYIAPLAAVTFLALYIITRVVPMPYGVKSLFPVIVNNDGVFVRYLPTAMLGQTVFFLALAAILLILTGIGARKGTAAAGIGLIVVLVGSAGAAAVITTNGQYLTGYNARDFVCDGTSPRVCVNRGYAEALPGLRERFNALNSKVEGTTLAASLLEQNVEGVGDSPSAGARSIYLEEISEPGLDFSVARYVEKYGGLSACDPEKLSTVTATAIVDTWLTGVDVLGISSFGEGAPGKRELQRFMQLDAAEGSAWLRDHADRYQTCALTLDDLP